LSSYRLSGGDEMVEFQVIFFWLGGVLTESVLDATLSVAREGKPGLKERIQIRGLVEQFTLGLLSPAEYCRRVLEVFEDRTQVGMLEDALIGRISLNEPVIELAGEIPGRIQLWLVSDYPAAWIENSPHARELSIRFPAERRIFSSELGVGRTGPEFFQALADQLKRPMAECLLVDADPARAVSAIRNGLASIIYVYPEHLKHELALQGIIQTDVEVLHPSSSERVDI
jgi:FMN phosphatase YigB (HAD superfamily)